MTDGACFGLFKGFKSPFTYYERDVNLVIIDEGMIFFLLFSHA